MANFRPSQFNPVPSSFPPHLPLKAIRMPGNDFQGQTLLDYVATLLPENIDPVHVLIGIGIAFTGVGGGLIVLHQIRKTPNNTPFLKDRPNACMLESTMFGKIRKPSSVTFTHLCPRGRKVPCIAPHPLKLETYLRVAGIKYQLLDEDVGSDCAIAKDIDDSTMKINMEAIEDTHVLIKEIMQTFGVDLSGHLTPKDRAVEAAFNHLLNEKIYWGISLYRWVYDGARSIDKIQCLPDTTRESIPAVARTVEHAAWHHGLGKRAQSQVIDDITQDISALSIQLGSNKYLMNNEKPSDVDCGAFAMLAQMLWAMDGPFHTAITKKYGNLAEFCWRMRSEYWPDWDKCIQD